MSHQYCSKASKIIDAHTPHTNTHTFTLDNMHTLKMRKQNLTHIVCTLLSILASILPCSVKRILRATEPLLLRVVLSTFNIEIVVPSILIFML